MPAKSYCFVLIISAQALLLAQGNAPTPNLRVERSPMVLRASGVSYDGIAHAGMSVERLAMERTDKYWLEVQSGSTSYFRSEGLGVYRQGDDAWVWYPMFGLAVAAGWFAPQPDDRYSSDDIEGLGIGGGRVWMGSNGVGIIARDLRDGRWSRHDAKATPLPGIHSTLLYADDDYVFALSGGPSGGWRERLPDVRSDEQLGPAVEVYSVRHGAWLRLVGVSRKNVLQFGWTDYIGVSMPCDTRPLARLAVVPLEFCTMPWYAKTARGEAGYELGRTFNEPGAPFRFVVRRKELDAAFKSILKRQGRGGVPY